VKYPIAPTAVVLAILLLLYIGAVVGATFTVAAQQQQCLILTEQETEYVANLRVVSVWGVDLAKRWQTVALRTVEAKIGPTDNDVTPKEWMPQ